MMAFVEQMRPGASSRPRAALTITSAWLAMTISASRLGPLGALDEAAAVMRAAGIDAFAAPVGQRGRTGAAEQARQPARQVAADHVAVLAVRRPAPDQLREDRGAAGERALQRVFEIEQAQVILAALAHDDPPRAFVGVGE